MTALMLVAPFGRVLMLNTISGCLWHKYAHPSPIFGLITKTSVSTWDSQDETPNCHQHQCSKNKYRFFAHVLWPRHTFGKNFCNSFSGIIPNNSFHAIVKQVLKSVIFCIMTFLSLLVLVLWHSVTGDDIIIKVVTAYITVFILSVFFVAYRSVL